MSACAVVTGAAGALGSAVARHLAKTRQIPVALLDSERHHDRLEALVRELGTARAYVGDLADAGAWIDILPRIEADLGPPQSAALVAGGYAGGAPFWETDEASWNAMLHGNLDTVAHALRALLPGMVARRDGRIVVIGSRAVERPWTGAGAAAYVTAKSAVVALAQAVAAEAREHGVTVNAVLPSTLDTPANRANMPDADASRWVPLDAAANQIGFLLSDDAREISGAAIPIYGRA